MPALFIIAVVIWLMIMTFLFTPAQFYASTWDKITKAKWRADRVPLQIMLDHLRSFPDQWSVNSDGASFPLQGAKQIYITHDKKTGWEYSLNNFGGKARPLDGHFGSQFVDAMVAENSRRESQALLRQFYPELDGPLLLK